MSVHLEVETLAMTSALQCAKQPSFVRLLRATERALRYDPPDLMGTRLVHLAKSGFQRLRSLQHVRRWTSRSHCCYLHNSLLTAHAGALTCKAPASTLTPPGHSTSSLLRTSNSAHQKKHGATSKQSGNRSYSLVCETTNGLALRLGPYS